MVVHQQHVGRVAAGVDAVRQRLYRFRRRHLAAPLLEQGAHAGTDGAVVIHHPDTAPGQGAAGIGGRLHGARLGGAQPGQRQLQGETRTPVFPRAHGQGVVEYAGDFFNDGQAQAEAPFVVFDRPGAAFEFLEDIADLIVADADAGVRHHHFHPLTATAAAEQDGAGVGVADRVGEQVAHYAAEQLRVGAHHRRAGHVAQAQPLGGGHLPVLLGEHVEQAAQWEHPRLGADHAGVQLGGVGQGGDQRFQIEQRGVDVAEHEFGVVSGLVLQRAGEQAGGVERLHQVVADGGHELGLGDVGALGLFGGLAQPRFHPPALLDFVQQLLVGFAQGLGAFTDLLGEHHRMLEGGVGRGGRHVALFHPFDQGVANTPQAGVFRHQARFVKIPGGRAVTVGCVVFGQSPPPSWSG